MSKTFINPEGITLKNIKDIVERPATIKFRDVLGELKDKKFIKIKNISLEMNTVEDDIEVEFFVEDFDENDKKYFYNWYEFNLKDIIEIKSEDEEEISNEQNTLEETNES